MAAVLIDLVEVVTASSIRRRSATWPFAGLDVSVKETSVCILDDAGKMVKKRKVASEAILTTTSGCDRYRNGYSALSPKPSYQ